MDVDAAPGERGGEPVGQDLHVAREHDRSAPVPVTSAWICAFLLCLGLAADGQVVKRYGAKVRSVIVSRGWFDTMPTTSIRSSPMRTR